ncbi:MAG: hypothetical protein PHD51_01960 [Patescibacteria group bacterium]|nr:hypothetical protein [Patescibacteria group bacterium]MDD5490375.1 hypothetical protein [Patescibacteria group bacterium]
MSFEFMPNNSQQSSGSRSERPRIVEAKLEQLLPTAQEMLDDPDKIDTYINMKVAQLDPVTKGLLSEETGKTGIKKEDRFREAIRRALPTHLESVENYGQTNEAFEKAVNNVIRKTIEGFKM